MMLLIFDKKTQNVSQSNTNYSVRLIDTPERRKYGAEWFVKKNNANKFFYPQKPVFYTYFIHSEIGQNEIIYIIYLMSYPYNGTLKSHKYDEEVCIVELVNGIPFRVGGSAHGNYTWWPYGDAKNRPEIFIAKGSHAVYDKPINHTRLFYFGNDSTNKGFKVDDYDIAIIDPNNISEEYKHLNFVGARNYKEWGHFTPRAKGYIEPLNYSPVKHSMTIINEFIDSNIYLQIVIWSLLVLPIPPIIYFNYSMVNNHNTPSWIPILNILSTFIMFTLGGVYFTVRTNNF